MAPQTTRREWSGLRLEGMLIIISVVNIYTFIYCEACIASQLSKLQKCHNKVKLSDMYIGLSALIPVLYLPCVAQVYTLEVTWSDGSNSQTHVNNSSLADWKVGHSLVSLLKAIAHRRHDATGKDETSDDRVDCEVQFGGYRRSQGGAVGGGEMSVKLSG